jgi:hypothetical protein
MALFALGFGLGVVTGAGLLFRKLFGHMTAAQMRDGRDLLLQVKADLESGKYRPTVKRGGL